MSNKLFFDIQFGASGDMLMGSLLDLGADFNKLIQMLSKLNVPDWTINPEKTVKYYFSGTRANVRCKDSIHSRNLHDIRSIIEASGLPDKVIQNIMSVFKNLAAAESRVHGKEIEEVHFHEIGAIDSIIDISAFCILMEILDVDEIFYGEFPFGTGTVKSAHGEIPVPVPAVVELMKGREIVFTDRPGELITPTAAAILMTLGRQANSLSFKLLKSGIGFGTREYSFPSYTRGFLIVAGEGLQISQIECNIDDMNPQIYPDIIDMLLEAGALDAYTCSLSMKKGRHGTLLTVLSETENIQRIKEIIYTQTTTLGLRIFTVEREKLHRDYENIQVSGNDIRIKIGYLNNRIINFQPEFEDCRAAANKSGLPLKEVIAEALHKYKLKNKDTE